MKFDKTIVIEAPVQEVWNFLWDMERVKSCIPVCKSVQEVEPKKLYEATVEDKVAPFSVSFQVQVNVLDAQEPSHIQLKGSGKDVRIASRATGTADMRLKPVDAGTEITLTSDVNILGKLGSLGHSIIIRKADEYTTIVTDQIKRQLEGNRPPEVIMPQQEQPRVSGAPSPSAWRRLASLPVSALAFLASMLAALWRKLARTSGA